MKMELIVLANSIKHGACCVAGKTIDGQWIRIVGDEKGKELTKEEASIINPHGSFKVKPLQKVIINFQGPAPLLNQPENYVNDSSIKWVQHYNITVEELRNYLDSPEDLWGDGSDKVECKKIQNGELKITNSLYLISVQNATLYVNRYNKRRLSFCYKELNYDLAVTSPNFDSIIARQNKIDNLVLCISLGEVFFGYYYKIVAHIF